MKVKDLCDVLRDTARITITYDRCCYDFEEYNISTNKLRYSKYKDMEIEEIRSFGVGFKDDFTIVLRR